VLINIYVRDAPLDVQCASGRKNDEDDEGVFVVARDKELFFLFIFNLYFSLSFSYSLSSTLFVFVSTIVLSNLPHQAIHAIVNVHLAHRLRVRFHARQQPSERNVRRRLFRSV
jgi:hypothetical protein